MNCGNHPEALAIAYCRTCGKPLCQECVHTANGTVHCSQHAAAASGGGRAGTPETPHSPYSQPYTANKADPGASAGVAFVLGLIPGVGAIYNGQYVKGLVHVLVLGLLISVLANNSAHGLEPLFGLLIFLLFVYMAFEAYHTARKRTEGKPVEEFSSLLTVNRNEPGRPVGPFILIGIGVIFLLNNLGILRVSQLIRFWPMFLILLGVYLLYARVTGTGCGSHPRPDSIPSLGPVASDITHPEVGHER